MGCNDVQGHKGIDSEPQMQLNVKDMMMIKDSRKTDTVVLMRSTARGKSTVREKIFMNLSISLEHKEVNQFNSNLCSVYYVFSDLHHVLDMINRF